jgi:2-methylcitrate dehydratase PrpD
MAGTGTAPQPDPVVTALGEWSRALAWNNLRAATQRAVRYELLDYLGCLIAGRAMMGFPGWIAELAERGGRGDANIVGGEKVPAPVAALANGYFGHVLELDDTHDAAVLHAGAAAIPAALAAAQYREIYDPAALLEAVLIGIDVTSRLGMATSLNLVDGGWIYTPLLGVFGATAASAKLLGADEKQFRNAFGIAYSFAAGTHQSSREGVSTKHAQPGFAAHNGVNAALMAINGLDSVQQVFNGEDGFARVFLHDRFDPARAIARLGVDYEIERLSFKPYPSCRFTHPVASAALELRARLGAHAPQATAIDVEMGPQAWHVVGRPEPARIVPTAKVTAQFSAYWVAAVAWHHGEVSPLHVFSEVPPSEPVRAWLERITCKPYENADTRDIGGATVTVRGPFSTESLTVNVAKGHPDNPFTDAEATGKFITNVKLAGWREQEAREFAEYILALGGEAGGDLEFLYEALEAPVVSTR